MFPIRKIVLFKHGVAYQERQKQVSGDASIDLFFKTAEMNDVLKSLTAVDLGGGSIASISYQAQTPIDKQLEQLSLHLSEGQHSLSELLKQAIGAAVSLQLEGGEQVEGTVIGLEDVQRVRKQPEGKEDRVETVKQLNLLMDGGSCIRSFPVFELESFEFKDATLRHDLQHLLDVILNAKKKDLKKLTIFTAGEGERTVLASYVIEAPVWKTSYRLLIGGPDSKHFIQGWCLVDNTQDEDWENVRLTLVGSRPNSFVHDLYSPRFRKRPMIQVKEEAPPKPPVLEEVLPHHKESLLREAPALLSDLDSGGPEMGQVEREKTEVPQWHRPSPSSIAVPPARQMKKDSVRKIKAVDVFQYPIKKPVSVKRGQSALVPFLAEEFKGKPVILYNQGVNASNPITVILFRNTFGVALDGGPISIFDEETCIGEAMLDTIRPGDVKFVPFGVDMNIACSSKTDSELRNVHKTSLSNGVLTLTRYRVYRQEYKFDHKGSADVSDFYLEHRFKKGSYELVDTDNPVSKTENFYRFYFKVPGNTITLFAVKERTLETSTSYLRNASLSTLKSWVSSKFIDDDTRKYAEKQIIPLRTSISEQEREISKENRELSSAKSRQSSAKSSVYRYNRQSKSLTTTEKEHLQTNLATMMDEEKKIKKLTASLLEKREKLKRDKAEFEKRLLVPKYSAELFTPPPVVPVKPLESDE